MYRVPVDIDFTVFKLVGLRIYLLNAHFTMIKHLKITGRVQGVGYRYFALQCAREIGVVGWVRNNRDGSVETVLSGSTDQIARMMEKLREGPFSAKVMAIEEMEPVQQDVKFEEFKIR